MDISYGKTLAAIRSPVPEGKRIPFGWSAAAIGEAGNDSRAELAWEGDDIAGPSRLRLSAALDVREEKRIEVALRLSGRVIGELDIRYAYVHQPFEIRLTAEDTAAVFREGITLRMTSGHQPFWFFTGEPDVVLREASLLVPHLVADTNSSGGELWAALNERLCSLSSIQQFSWMEGCVLDGLLDLSDAYGWDHARITAKAHLALFFDPNGSLVYENPRSEPVDGKVYGIEGTLPFAALARLQPDHPSIAEAISFWLAHTEVDGAIWDGGMLSAEGSYTIAYPMAVLARIYGRNDLKDAALRQLRVRASQLVRGDDLALRYHRDGSLSFTNWSRAYAWYMLGLIRTLRELPDLFGTEDVQQEFIRVSRVAMKHQMDDGLWAVFTDEPDTGADTSGSAGIAASLALGANSGFLGEEATQAAIRTYEALAPFITSDGVLGGVAQSNKGGEALQRSGYRVMSQMGMGIAAQLDAALRAQHRR